MNNDFLGWSRGHGGIALEGFIYERLQGDDAPLEARWRLAWLGMMNPGKYGIDFWPQPYDQLAKVFWQAGHEAGARDILIRKENLQRAANRHKLFFAAWLLAWNGDWMLCLSVGYGRRPSWAIWLLVLFWWIGATFFLAALNDGALKPNNAFVLRADEWVGCADAGTRRGEYTTQYACFLAQPQAASYPRFNAAIYSLDTLLPIVALEMQAFWIPDEDHPFGYWARIYLWVQIGLGWALSLLAVAGFSGLIRSDSGT